jgi:hypothetical protein
VLQLTLFADFLLSDAYQRSILLVLQATKNGQRVKTDQEKQVLVTDQMKIYEIQRLVTYFSSTGNTAS